MKKIIKVFFVTFLALMMIVGSALCVNAATYNIKHAGDNGVNAYYGTPKLDGVIDDIWKKSTTIYTEWAVTGVDYNSFIGTGLEGSYGKVMWDEKYAYFLIYSNDSTYSDVNKILPGESKKGEEAREYLGELVQIWVTEAMLDTETYYVSEGNYYMCVYRSDKGGKKGQCTIADKTHPERMATETFCEYAIKDNGSHYIVEMRIPWHDITPENDTEIGVNFSINDDTDGDGWREYFATWTGKKYIGNNNKADLAPVVLVGGPEKKTSGKTNNKTSDASSGNTSSGSNEGDDITDTDDPEQENEYSNGTDTSANSGKKTAAGFSKEGLAAIAEANSAVKGARTAVLVASILLGVAALAGIFAAVFYILKAIKKK